MYLNKKETIKNLSTMTLWLWASTKLPMKASGVRRKFSWGGFHSVGYGGMGVGRGEQGGQGLPGF